MKICFDCKHLELNAWNPQEGSVCSKRTFEGHPVSGSTEMSPFHPFAAGERLFGECGPEAKFFEGKRDEA